MYNEFLGLLGVLFLLLLITIPIFIIALWVRVNHLEKRLKRLLKRLQLQSKPPIEQEEDFWLPNDEADERADQPPQPEAVPALSTVMSQAGQSSSESFATSASINTPSVTIVSQRGDEEESHFSFEELLAGQWMAWIGALAIVLGAGFAFKYAIENDWIGPAGRVGIGIITGLICFTGGSFAMLKNYRYLSQGLIATAGGILYFAIYAACRFHGYDLISDNIAFGCLILVTAVTLTFSTKFNAMPTAILSLIAGYLTPIMLATDVDKQWEFFSYILILDLGVLGVATFRKWQSLQMIAFGGTVVLWIGWFQQHYDPSKLNSTFILMTLFFVLFSLMGVWHHVVRKVKSEPGDFFLILATPIVYFTGLYKVTDLLYSSWHGVMAVTLAGAYLLLGLFSLSRYPQGKATIVSLIGIAATFLTIAIPLHLTGHWIAIAWAVEALLLVELGLMFHQPKLQATGFFLLLFVQFVLFSYALKTVHNPSRFNTRFTKQETVITPTNAKNIPNQQDVDASNDRHDAHPAWTTIFNGRSFSFLANAMVMAILAWDYYKRFGHQQLARSSLSGEDSEMSLPASAQPENSSLLNRGFLNALMIGTPFAFLGMLIVEIFSLGTLSNWLSYSIIAGMSIVTALVALLVIVMSQSLHSKTLRTVGMCLFGLLVLLLGINSLQTIIDWNSTWQELTDNNQADSFWAWFVLNPRGISFLIALFAAIFAAWFCHPQDAAQQANPIDIQLTSNLPLDSTSVLIFHATVATWAMLTVETYAQGIIQQWETGIALAITGVWTMYAIMSLVFGIITRHQVIRILGLILFVATTVKVFFYDIWYLDVTIRFIAFGGLGVSLLLVSFLYRRFQTRIRSWIAPILISGCIGIGYTCIPQVVVAELPDVQHATLLQKLEYRWAIEDDQIPLPASHRKQTLRKIIVPPELYRHTNTGLWGMRLLAVDRSTSTDPPAAVEIPYLLKIPVDRHQKAMQSASIMNLSQKGTNTEFMLFMGQDRIPISRVRIQINPQNVNYIRKVSVFGADQRDAKIWNLLTDDGYLLDRTRADYRTTISHVTFPRSRYNFFKIVIANEKEAPLKVDAVSIIDEVNRKIKRREYQGILSNIPVEDHQQKKQKQYLVDLQYEQLPTDQLTVTIEHADDFYRQVRVDMADQLHENPQKTRWEPITSGTFFRIKRTTKTLSNFELKYKETRGRYFRLTVHHGDDLPVNVTSCSAGGIERMLIVQQKDLTTLAKGTSLALYVGSKMLGSPDYDLQNVVNIKDKTLIADLEKIQSLKMRTEEKNPFYGFTPVIPFSEKNKPLLWIITIAGVMILGGISFLMLRKVSQTS